jgi:hypothetical protein
MQYISCFFKFKKKLLKNILLYFQIKNIKIKKILFYIFLNKIHFKLESLSNSHSHPSLTSLFTRKTWGQETKKETDNMGEVRG